VYPAEGKVLIPTSSKQDTLYTRLLQQPRERRKMQGMKARAKRKRVKIRKRDINAQMDRLFKDTPPEAARVKTDLVRVLLDERE
jgi:hypothetical protein